MRILALQGSPRPKGNTQTVLELVLRSAKDAGAKVETVQLGKLKNISGCLECYGCQSEPTDPGCHVDDDLLPVIGKALKSDLIVWATPVFCWSPAWPLKPAMDRFFCTFKFGSGDKYTSLLKGRKMAAVITSGGGEEDGADLVMETFRRMAKFSQTRWLGAFVVPNAANPAALLADKALARRAAAFGKKLAV